MSDFIRAEEYCVAVKDGTHNSPKKTENGVKLATSKNIIGGNLDLSTAYFISEEDANEVNKRSKVDKNDILISMIGTVGEVCLIKDDPDFVIKNVGLLKNKCAYKAKWLYFYLKTNQAQNLIKERLRGTTQQYLSLGELRNFPVLLPKNEDHLKNAVNILWELEQKIQLNTQINQTLEQIAQTIFKSWFIDFDPVHAKANALASGQAAEQATQAAMAVISGKNTQELHRLQTANPEQYQQLWEIAEAFPSGFDEEGVPRRWEEKFFGELLENTIGGDWGKDEVDEKHTEKVSILRGTDLPDVYKGNDKDVPTRFVEQKKLKSRKLQYSDIVIEVSGGSKNQPTGRSLLITDKLLSRFNNPIVPASFCRLFRPKSENYGYLLALHLQIIYQQGKTWEYQNQSTGISNFQTTHFLETEKVILPTNKTLMYFAEMVNPIFDKIYSDENQRLAEIRDELLPKLLSGEV
ncbi:restriction endonuclease subunit S [[Pasteurella] aerogenes]